MCDIRQLLEPVAEGTDTQPLPAATPSHECECAKVFEEIWVFYTSNSMGLVLAVTGYLIEGLIVKTDAVIISYFFFIYLHLNELHFSMNKTGIL